MQYISAGQTGPDSNQFQVSISPADSLLLLAVEEGVVEDVRMALKAGADPNCRKRVVIGCTVWEGSKSVKKLLKGGTEERGTRSLARSQLYAHRMNNELHSQLPLAPHSPRIPAPAGTGPSTNRFVERYAESALALAILQDSTDIVEVLLGAGADPNAPISWQILRPRSVFTETTWRWTVVQGNWDFKYTFQSAVELALGTGQVVDFQGSPALPVQDMAARGTLWVNKPGAIAQLLNPTGSGSTFNEIALIPNTDIIQLLLAHGARPTPAARDAMVNVLTDTSRLEKLEKARMERLSRGTSSSSVTLSLSPSWSSLSSRTTSRSTDSGQSVPNRPPQ
ncbi:hypothetical protein HDU93_007629 [Gonapodya sp. JEL0774]|nr:hypothetical protein HDU93_007629 [Gonapodya sp. JEL0774]